MGRVTHKGRLQIRLTKCFVEQFLRFSGHRRKKIPKQIDSQSERKDRFEEEDEFFFKKSFNLS
jgi:hypothetical protein